MSSATCFNLDQYKILLSGNGLTINLRNNKTLDSGPNEPFPKQALVFTCLLYKCIENSVEKEKLPVMSNFSFFNNVFKWHLPQGG